MPSVKSVNLKTLKLLVYGSESVTVYTTSNVYLFNTISILHFISSIVIADTSLSLHL